MFTCQGAAGAGCFSGGDEPGGKGKNEGSPSRALYKKQQQPVSTVQTSW